jgi:hypothetical protein
MKTTSSPEPRYAAFIDRDEAKDLGITCSPAGYDRERSRLRTRLSVRLTHPREMAQIESDVRDERVYVDREAA